VRDPHGDLTGSAIATTRGKYSGTLKAPEPSSKEHVMQLVLYVVAIVLFAVASISAVAVKQVHLGWLGAAFLAGALLVGSGSA